MNQAKETAKDADDRERLDKLLDAALAATFPASDPVALRLEQPSQPLSQNSVAPTAPALTGNPTAPVD